MLLSPGHSPRGLSSPSPSLANSENNPTTSSSITPSSKPRNHRNRVLDEDSYVAAIEKIIERDFFPDISKLRDRLDWLEALKSRDPLLIRDAQLKIIERRRGNSLARPPGNDSERRTQTPGSTFVRNFTPFDEFDAKTPKPDGTRVSGPEEEVCDGAAIDPSLSLDEFFRRYTSEDNESFSKILEKVNRKRKERFGYLIEGEKKEEEVRTIEDVKRDRITDGYGTSDQPPSTLVSWNYTAKNLLMYHPADRGEAPLTVEERAVRMKSLEKEISRPNTRLHGNNTPSDSCPHGGSGESLEVVYAPVAGATPVLASRGGDRDKSKKYDLDDLRKTPERSRSDGYSFVRTPSPAPGAEGSPFITWGEIEGTPLRLDFEEDEIGGTGDGPRYKVPCPATRDEKAHSLSREAARQLRERSRMFRKPPLPTPQAARGGSASPSARLSPAAQKFVRNAISKNSAADVDETLRASYRGSSPRAGTGTTPRVPGRSVSRLGRESNRAFSRSPSVGEGSNLPWIKKPRNLLRNFSKTCFLCSRRIRDQ